MGVLSDWLTSMRSSLVSGASLVNLPADLDIDDLPASKRNKTFRLAVRGGERLGATHGGGTLVEKFATAELEIHWDPALDREAIANTIADDMKAASGQMLKASNRTSGIVLVTEETPLVVDDSDSNDVLAHGTYTVRFRETQDLT